WKVAQGAMQEGAATVNWLQDDVFYTWTASATEGDHLTFGRVGANDPKFNLRRDPVFIWQRQAEGPTVFASVTEAHGRYSPVTERAESAYSQIRSVQVLSDSEAYTAVKIQKQDGTAWLFVMANEDPEPASQHTLQVNGQTLAWSGPVHFSILDSSR
ncbi:MAG: heparinase, partial [Bacteroidota bacterium]